MALQLNPTVADPFPTFPLYQLRRQVFDSLGFLYSQAGGSTVEYPILFDSGSFAQMGPLPATDGSGATNSPNSLVYEIKQRLGLPNAIGIKTDNLGTLLTQLANFIGLGAMIKFLPGNVMPMLTNFINQAEQDLWRDIELDSGGTATGSTLIAPPNRMGTGTVTSSTATFAIAAVGATQVVAVTSATGIAANVVNTGISITDGISAISGIVTVVAGLNVTVQTTAINAGAAGVVMATNAMVAYGSTCTLDSTAIMQRAIALAKEYYGQDDAQLYMEQSKKYVADYARRSPPNITSVIQLALIDAQRKILRRAELGGVYLSGSPPYLDSGVLIVSGAQGGGGSAGGKGITLSRFLEPTDATSIDKEPVLLLALATVKDMLKQADGKQAMDEFERYMSDLVKRLPPDASSFVTNALRRAQETLYRMYKVFRMERWFTWTEVANQNFYSIYGDDNLALQPPTGVTATVGAASAAATMLVARATNTVVTLTSGKVLYVGGFVAGLNLLSSAETYDPTTGTFSPAGALNIPRALATATLLPNGTVLIAGGVNPGVTSSCEIFDPNALTFAPTGSLNTARGSHTSVMLKNGLVLAIGGSSTPTSCELFNPASGTWTVTGSLSAARLQPSITLLLDGRVLVAGGDVAFTAVNTAEVYDPVAGTWSTLAGHLVVARGQATSVLLNTGKVLIAGGESPFGTPIASCELFDPSSNSFAATGAMSIARISAPLTLLSNNNVLVAGDGQGSATAEVYNVTTQTWSATANTMPGATVSLLPVALSNGLVLIAGGQDASNAFYATVQLYNPTTNLFAFNGSLTTGNNYYRVAAQTQTGTVLVGGTATIVSPGTTTPSVQAVALGQIAAAVMTITAMEAGVFAVGDVITGLGVAANTTIVSFGTGTGQSGTYNVTPAQAVTAGTVLTANDAVVQGVPANTSVLIAWIPLASSNVTGYAIYGRTIPEQLIAVVPATQSSYVDNGTAVPSGAMPALNSTASSFGALDPREVSAVYRSSNGTNWSPILEGIPPAAYNATTTGPPQRYQIRQALEIWPPPTDSTWQIQVRGFFSPLPFATDTDTNSIDPQAIYLKAKIDAEIHYKRGSPDATREELDSYIGHLIAGSHNTARYVPGGACFPRDATRPVFLGRTP